MDPLLWLKYKKVKGSAAYNFNIICILATKSTTKNNVFIKKEGSQYAMLKSQHIDYLLFYKNVNFT